MPTFGLVMISTAPISKARMAASVLGPVNPRQTTTGTCCWHMNFSLNSHAGGSSNSLNHEQPGRGAAECKEHRRAPTNLSTKGKLWASRPVAYRRRHEGSPHGRGTDIRRESNIFPESRQLLFSFPIV